ncbi:MAG: metallophosphoesterase [Deltaproteobacteria bacterium]|nr:metallophosphoesterase [Deltaproteobacteria bacterium]MCB9788422.1 metallophosphoesterase [Deltaproteobacteria bacterium]
MSLFATVAITLVLLIHYYLWARLVRDTHLGGTARFAGTSALVVLLLALLASVVLRRSVEREVLGPLPLVAWTWAGLMFYLLLLLGVGDLIRAASRLTTGLRRRLGRDSASPGPPDPGRRQALARLAAGGAVLGSAGLGIYGVRRARSGDFETPEHVIAIPRLPRALDGYRIVQLSDVHVGPTIGRRFLDEMVERTNALRPDLVVITGDLVDGSVAMLGQDVGTLSKLRARHGTAFVTGNHEFFSGVDEWLTCLRRLGIQVLGNQRVSIGDRGPGGASFDLAGIHDAWGGRRGDAYAPDLTRALRGRDPERALVLLAHQPKQIDMAEGHGVDLQLSGHTHGGQLWPFGEATALVQPWIRGLHSRGDTRIYVSKGTGYWGPPMRVGAPPEIASLVLTAG